MLRLAQEMRNGKFRLTSDSIVLLKGRLANGQHRLTAITESGQSCKFIVMRSDDDELFKVIDCGRMRSVADVIVNIPHAKVVAPVARLVIAYDRKLLGASGENTNKVKKQPVRSDIFNYIEKHCLVLSDQASFVCSHYDKSRIVGATVATALLHIASRKNEDIARTFIEHIYGGEVVDASIDFRDRMIKQLGTKSRF